MIRFACPTCGGTFRVDDEKAGKRGKCPQCQTRFVIPPAADFPPPARPSRPADDRPRRPSRHRDDEDDRPRRRDDADDFDFDDRPRRRSRRDDAEECKKVSAGVFALLLGGWGVHKFYLGYTTAGVIQLVLTLVTCGLAGVIPFIEGIIYLTRTDRDFVRTYQRRRREWF